MVKFLVEILSTIVGAMFLFTSYEILRSVGKEWMGWYNLTIFLFFFTIGIILIKLRYLIW